MEFQDRDWVEVAPLVILNVRHIEEIATYEDAVGDTIEHWIAALEDIESFDGPEIVS